jgi:hypothetical protein
VCDKITVVVRGDWVFGSREVMKDVGDLPLLD